MAIQMAQFMKLIRMFEDELNADVVHSILMLQQFKRMVLDLKGNADGMRTLEQLLKEHPNLSTFVVSLCVFSWIARKERQTTLSTLIGLELKEFISRALIKGHFFALFEFEAAREQMV